MEDEGGFGGLDAAGANIGNGAGLYLQMMKTLAFLFLFLTIINIPVYLTYYDAATNHNFSDMGFSYLTLGTIGMPNSACTNTIFDPTKIPFTERDESSITIKCVGEHEYLQKICEFGFLQSFNLEFNKNTTGSDACKQIEGNEKPWQLRYGGTGRRRLQDISDAEEVSELID